MKVKFFKKIFSVIIIICFLAEIFFYPVCGQTDVTSQPFVSYDLPVLRYLSVNSGNPYNYFNFLIDKGSASLDVLTPQAKQAVNYFFLGITLSDDSFWVNLRPDEPDLITSESLGKTEMGKVLLNQDLQLKRDMARYLHPSNSKGREFWQRLYAIIGKDKVKKAKVVTSNRVWITPGEAVVMETEDGAFVARSSLKVMLESEYLQETGKVAQGIKRAQLGSEPVTPNSEIDNISEALMKEIVIPEITREVNFGERYAALRQIYNSLVLAQWFKLKYREEKGAYPFMIDKGYTKGLESRLPWSKQKIWQKYIESYENGEYKIKDVIFGMRRMYFSGGIFFNFSGAQRSRPAVVGLAVQGGSGINSGGLSIQEDAGSSTLEIRKIEDSPELLDEIRALNPKGEIPIIAVTALDNGENFRFPYLKTVIEQALPLKTGASPIVTVMPKDTFLGRNNDTKDIITSQFLLQALGLNLATGPHCVVNIGAGVLPLDAIEESRALKTINPDIKVLVTELPGVTAKAHISSKALVERFREKIEKKLLYDVALKDLRLEVDNENRITDIVVGYVMNNDPEKILYQTLAVAPGFAYQVEGSVKKGELYKNVTLFREIVGFLGGEDRLVGLIKGGEVQYKDENADISIDYNPVSKALENIGVEFIPTDNLAKSGIKDVSLITANYVVEHMAEPEKQNFMEMTKESLAENGVLLIKKGTNYGNNIELYQKKNNLLIKKDEFSSSFRGEFLFGPSYSGIFSLLLKERQEIFKSLLVQYPKAQQNEKQIQPEALKLIQSVGINNDEFSGKMQALVEQYSSAVEGKGSFESIQIKNFSSAERFKQVEQAEQFVSMGAFKQAVLAYEEILKLPQGQRLNSILDMRIRNDLGIVKKLKDSYPSRTVEPGNFEVPTPGVTYSERLKATHPYILSLLQNSKEGKLPLIVDLGTGYVPVTTKELAVAVEGRARVLGVDQIIPDMTIEITAYPDGSPIDNNGAPAVAFFDKQGQFLYGFVAGEPLTVSLIELVFATRERLLKNQFENSSIGETGVIQEILKDGYDKDHINKITYNPFKQYEVGNLKFRKGGFNLPLKDGEKANVVRVFNVTRYYEGKEDRVLKELAPHVKDGGYIIVGDDSSRRRGAMEFLTYQKMKDLEAPVPVALGTQVLFPVGDVLFSRTGMDAGGVALGGIFAKYKGIWSEVGDITSEVWDEFSSLVDDKGKLVDELVNRLSAEGYKVSRQGEATLVFGLDSSGEILKEKTDLGSFAKLPVLASDGITLVGNGNNQPSSAVQRVGQNFKKKVGKEGGIDLSKIELTLKDKKFVSSLNSVDLKILRAVKALNNGLESLAVLYVHEAMLLLKYNLASDFTQQEAALQVLFQLKSRQDLNDSTFRFFKELPISVSK